MNANPIINMISIELIIPNRFQPRLTFDEQGINELSSSIKEHGIIQPLVLRKLGDKYEIIAGERRYKAATVAGLTEVPAIISNLDDNQSAEVALVENVQRKNLTSIEEAKSYKKILEKGYLTQELLAKKMGVSQSNIANKLRLLNLTSNVQEALLNDRISERHARSLLRISDPEVQVNMLNRVTNERMTVRQLDVVIKELLVAESTPPLSDDIADINKPVDVEVESSGLVVLNEEFKTEEVISRNDDIESLDDLIDKEANDELEEMKNNAQDIIPKEKKSAFNIFDQNKFSSLEDESVNLSVPNIFDDKQEENIELEEDTLDIPEFIPTVPVIAESSASGNKVRADSLPSVIRAYNELEKEVEQSGYKISTEEFDFEDLYQIIIKIEKET